MLFSKWQEGMGSIKPFSHDIVSRRGRGRRFWAPGGGRDWTHGVLRKDGQGTNCLWLQHTRGDGQGGTRQGGVLRARLAEGGGGWAGVSLGLGVWRQGQPGQWGEGILCPARAP